MYKGHCVAVVVPAFREERLIAQTIRGIPSFVDHIVVVDDASPDGTTEAAAATGEARLNLVRLSENQGVGGAVITGHRIAMDLGAEINVVMAGDDQMDPEELPRLLDPIVDSGYGFTKANRIFSPTSLQGMPAHRIFGNMMLTFLNKAASGYWNLVDPQNGYTAVTREALERIPLDRVAKRYEFENDLLIWLNIAGIRARDVDIPARYGNETSTIQLRTVVPRMLALFVRGFWRRIWLKYTLWSFSPIALLFFGGLLALGVGLAVGAWVAATAVGGDSPTAGTAVLAVVPFFTGFHLLVQAFVLDIQASPD